MTVYVKGLIARLDTNKTSSGRTITSTDMQNAIDESKVKIDNRQVLSELFPTERTSNINLDKVGGVVTELYIENGGLYGTVEILDTSTSRAYKDILSNPDSKYMLTFRMYGSVTMLGTSSYVTDLHVISVDIMPYDFSDEGLIAQAIVE